MSAKEKSLKENNSETHLEWTSHPFLDFPKTSWLLILFFIGMGFVLWRVTVVRWDQPIYYFLGVGILFFGTITYFIPTHYSFEEYKIVIHYWLFKMERRYTEFGCYYSDKKGVMLSTFKTPRRLDPFRGLNVRFSKEQSEKEELFEILERKIGNRK